ncbi:MAG: heparinase, partial [Sphingobacteriales bacterium]
MRFFFQFFLVTLLLPCVAISQAERNWLAGAYNKEQLAGSLTMDLIRQQYPGYQERTKWEAIDPNYRQQLISDGESVLNYTWQTIPATSYLEFTRSGNRRVMEDVYNMNIAAIRKLVFAELAEGKGRFIPQLINGVWAVCEISSWSISASIALQKAGAGLPDIKEPVIELGAGITVNALAWTYHLFKETFDKQSPLISQRLKQEIDRRLLQPYYTRNDFWWMALDGKKRMVNNWNVWLNYNMLTTILLVEEDPEKRAAGIYKTMQSVDQFINYYKEDGACEEGPAYWSHAGGMLYNYLSLLQQATGNTINIFDKPLIRNIGSYICKAYIDSSWYLNYADAGARIKTDAAIVYHYGKAVNDEQLRQFGSWLAKDQHWDKMVPMETLYGGFRYLFTAKEMLRGEARQPFMASAWMKETGIAVARDQE